MIAPGPAERKQESLPQMDEPEEIEVGEMEADEGLEGLEDVEGEEGLEDVEGELGPEEDDLGELAEVNYIDEDALMETVLKRVTNRLIKEKRTEEMANVLAEKISKKLARKKSRR